MIKNALPFASASDPRVPAVESTDEGRFDGTTPLFSQQVRSRRAAIRFRSVSGIDARLIEAEAKLQRGRLRRDDDDPQRAAHDARRRSAPKTCRRWRRSPRRRRRRTRRSTLFFREKAFWTFGRGQRLSDDLRRVIRQYGRTQDQVFPIGAFFKGGVYGTDVNFPVTDNEKTNPNFQGCIDRKA